ncbi:glyoxalase [bacterium]|nr:MAG: glyoxalase [bacterium]
MPAISGILETALYVDDLDRSERFYRELFGVSRILGDDRIRALRLPGDQVLLLFRKGASTQPSVTDSGIIPPHDGDGRLHLAFRIDRANDSAWREHLTKLGISLESGIYPCSGVSLYFRDPDGHCIELASTEVWPDHSQNV